MLNRREIAKFFLPLATICFTTFSYIFAYLVGIPHSELISISIGFMSGLITGYFLAKEG